MSTHYKAKKEAILAQLNMPDKDYNDLSPKGSIDEPIRKLIDEINQLDGLVTTSSCSGRISVYMEGKKKTSPASDDPEPIKDKSIQEQAGPGGKGGGSWLFVSHDSVDVSQDSVHTQFHSLFGLGSLEDKAHLKFESSRRFIHLKFEAMVCMFYNHSRLWIDC